MRKIFMAIIVVLGSVTFALILGSLLRLWEFNVEVIL